MFSNGSGGIYMSRKYSSFHDRRPDLPLRGSQP